MRAVRQNLIIASALVVGAVVGLYLGNWIADLTPWIN